MAATSARGLGVYALGLLFVTSVSTAAGAATHGVPAGGDLQAALESAQPGDVVVLEAGATYIGNFVLPVKGSDRYITLRTGGSSFPLPAPGTRVLPTHAAGLAKIKSPNTAPALSTAAGAHHWRIELVEFKANAKGAGDIIRLGASGSAQAQVAQMPYELVLDRVYIHGDPLTGQKRGIALNSGSTQIVNSYIADIKAVGQDSQAIAGWNGSGPYLIENNHLEGAGENVLFGGADPAVPGLIPSDITIRRNLFTKPLQWRNQEWQVKNAFELKNARRVLIEGNVFEHVWVAAQAGFAVLFSTRNQDGRAPWSVVEDVTFRYNIIRHAANAINISGYDDKHPSAQGRRYHIAHNIVYDISGAKWGGSGIFLQIGNQPRDIVVEHNTVEHTGNVVTVYGKRNGAPAVIDGFIFRDNLLRHNKYGVKGDSLAVGVPTITAYFPGALFEGNVLAGGTPSQYPAGNYFPSVGEFETAFADPAAGDFSLVPGTRLRNAATGDTPVGADLSRFAAAESGGQASPDVTPAPGDPKEPSKYSTGRWALPR